jgi:hypothetical protein
MESENDMLHIHEKILKFFQVEKENMPTYQKLISILIYNCLNSYTPYGIVIERTKIEELSSKYEDDTKHKVEEYTYREYKNMYEFIFDLHNYILNLEIKQCFYYSVSTDIITLYKEYLNKPQKSAFIGKNKDKNINTINESILKYNELIKELQEFINIVVSDKMQYYFKKYIKSKFKTSYKCFNPFQEKKIDVGSKDVKPKKNIYCDCFDRTEDSNGNVLCKNCGNIYSEVEDNINYNDYSRVNIVKRYHYEKKCHFHDTINQYQGKQNKYIPESVYEDVKYMIKMHGLSLDKLTINHVYLFLKETGNFKFYEDKQLIYSNIVGKPKPDISKYEKILYEDFDKLVNVFLKIKGKRKNFLHSHYVLRQLLLRQGVKIGEDELNSLSTPARLREHDELYEKCCDILGWNFTPLA